MRRHSSASPFRVALMSALGALAVMGSASTAAAHSWYPGWIQEHYGVGCAPSCLLCHTDPLGGKDKVKQPVQDGYIDGAKPSHRGFGVFVSNWTTMSPTGWPGSQSAQDQKEFFAKFDSLAKQPCQTQMALGDTTDMGVCDSDGDSKPDWQELSVGNDPDTVGPGPECPKYGCGAHIGTLPQDPGMSGRGVATMTALGVMLVLARRIRR
jgi:hypothetical protein